MNPVPARSGVDRWLPRRLSSRIVVLFLGLLLLVQGAGFAVVNWSIERNARELLAQDLLVGERVWARLLEQRAQKLALGASVLASDYGFREAVSSRDEDTLQSALANHGARIGATLTAMLAPDLSLRALGEGSDPAPRRRCARCPPGWPPKAARWRSSAGIPTSWCWCRCARRC